MRTLIAVALALWATSAEAGEAKILGQGNVSCGRWVNADTYVRTVLHAWVLGFVTAMDHELTQLKQLGRLIGYFRGAQAQKRESNQRRLIADQL